jgi:hypothetical protein
MLCLYNMSEGRSCCIGGAENCANSGKASVQDEDCTVRGFAEWLTWPALLTVFEEEQLL